MSESLALRLTGDDRGVGAMVTALHGLPGVEGVEDLRLDMPARDDDSSSAGLPDDTAMTNARDVRIDVADEDALDAVQGRIETMAAGAGVVVEWLDGE